MADERAAQRNYPANPDNSPVVIADKP